ncbi:hypothetical protein FQN53_003573 [Emmonsiellopsis sp. PD_33]|nr:hypothetical protein FQN53_003573 [Emmonsiellopsis sp. PD_33]
MATTKKKFRHQDYSVAWICALPLETAAAEAMLDDRHPSLPTRPNDGNSYILGSISTHNVVILSLPLGVYGTTSATASVAQMQATFGAIRFGLMVGIGGGVPSKDNDIRLGDVVVSKPTRDFGGVIQYDYGKTARDGLFERSGVLNKPPQVLLSAMTRLMAAHMSNPSRIPAILSEIASNNPQIEDRLTYLGQEQDILFEHDYDHASPETTCHKCDPSRAVARKPRDKHDPVIHYGLIASGNQVIKDGKTRDRRAKELDILCFEMEAAGLMDNIPCLVIRGICDYADSHKNKQWQNYAASTAAVYAKDLLSVIHPNQVVDVPPANSVTELSYHTNSARSEKSSTGLTVWQSHDQVDEWLVDRISSYDHDKVHRRLSDKRLIGSTQWFLDHPKFKAWFIEKTSPSLWCSGKIGSGKTIIATSVVEMAKYRSPNLRAPVVFFYFENDHYQTLRGSCVLSSFIKQLCGFLRLASKPCPVHILNQIRRFFGRKPTVPDFEDVKHIFVSLFYHVPDTIYILDGIDAVDHAHGTELLTTLRTLFHGSRPLNGSRILLLSREQIPGYINMTTLMPGISEIPTLPNVMADIQNYIETTVRDKTAIFRKLTSDPILLEEVKQALLFLWVYLQLEILWDTCFTDAEVRSALNQLPKNLEETYRRCVKRINVHDDTALKILKWVSFSTRPLHIEEMREGVAFDLQDNQWDPDKIPQEELVAGCCANLVALDPTDRCLRFAHSSVKQYLEKDRGRGFPGYPTSIVEGELECGELCINYLSFPQFSLQLDKGNKETAVVEIPKPALMLGEVLASSLGTNFFRTLVTQKPATSLSFRRIQMPSKPDRTRYKFLDYAVANWGLQTKRISPKSPVWMKFEQLATCFNETWNFHPWISGGRSPQSHLHALFGWAVKEQHKPMLSIALNTERYVSEICDLPLVDERLPALHVVSKLGYFGIVEILLGVCQVNVRDTEGYTALHHAASRGHVEIVQLLSRAKGTKLDILSRDGCTPLWLAASNGHAYVVNILIGRQARLDIPGSDTRQTPLSQAVINGHYDTVNLLVQQGANLDSRDIHCRTPLSLAAENYRGDIMELLLKNGADPNTSSPSADRFLICAVRARCFGATELLLAHISDINFKDDNGRAALSYAAEDGNTSIVNLLLAKNADIECGDGDEIHTPLIWAAENGHDAVVAALLAKGARLSGGRKTAMCVAAKGGHKGVVKLLLSKSSEIPEDTYQNCEEALWLAAKEGHGAVVRLLLENGQSATINRFTPIPVLVLNRAARAGDVPVMRILFENGADVNSKTFEARTPLHVAADVGQDAAVRVLLENGADINSKDAYTQTPLRLATRNGYDAVVRVLLEMGANIEDGNHEGETPLIIAAKSGHIMVVRLLLQHGAEVLARDRNGEIARELAIGNTHITVADLLVSEQALILRHKRRL